MDGQAFLRRERGTVEPQGLWAKNLSTETWRKETKDLKEKVEDLRKCLGEILGLQKEKGGERSGEGSRDPGGISQESLWLRVTCPFPLDSWGGWGGWVRKGVCELSMEVALIQQHREDREGSREQARWLEFLTWREETEGPGDWRSHCQPGGQACIPSRKL